MKSLTDNDITILKSLRDQLDLTEELIRNCGQDFDDIGFLYLKRKEIIDLIFKLEYNTGSFFIIVSI